MFSQKKGGRVPCDSFKAVNPARPGREQRYPILECAVVQPGRLFFLFVRFCVKGHALVVRF